MKKIPSLLTGIVLLITILIASSCCRKGKDDSGTIETEDTSPKSSFIVLDNPNVTIYLNDTLINGRKHLLLYDSKDTTHIVVDTLTTEVHGGDIIHWRTIQGSSIKKINNIRPVEENGVIFPIEALGNKLMTAFQLKIPDNAPSGTEKYEIVFTDNDDKTWCVDPYLKLPETRSDPDR